MATPWNDFDLPVVGADADVWGGKINAILTAIDVLLSSPANTIKGNNTGAQAATDDLTVAEVTAMLNPFQGVGVGNTKGLVPAPGGSDNYRVLTGSGGFVRYVGRAFGCVITTTSVNGSQPTLSGVSNVASVSTVATVGSVSTVTLTFSEALPDANYSVHAQCPNYTIPTGYDNKTTNTVKISWNGNPGEVSVSGF